jgi:hypothetical protein
LIGGPTNNTNIALNQAQQIYLTQNAVRPTSVGNTGTSGLVGKKNGEKKIVMQDIIINNPQLIKPQVKQGG